MIRDAEKREAHILLNHIDGPALIQSDGGIRWLTWRERFMLWVGLANAESLDTTKPELRK